MLPTNNKNMEGLYMIVGVVMIYSWIHSSFIMLPLVSKLKGYDKFVSIMAIVWFVLVIIGIFTGSYK